MRLITIPLSAAIIALAAAAPALATTSGVAKPGSESPAPTPCHAYEQNPDGSWKEIGCAEDGIKPPAPAKISTRNEGKTSH
jgi:hypothetical protein